MRTFGAENVTLALYQYRPDNPVMLSFLLSAIEKREIKERFAWNTMSGILKSLSGTERESYSEFCDRLDGRVKPQKTTEEIKASILELLQA